MGHVGGAPLRSSRPIHSFPCASYEKLSLAAINPYYDARVDGAYLLNSRIADKELSRRQTAALIQRLASSKDETQKLLRRIEECKVLLALEKPETISDLSKATGLSRHAIRKVVGRLRVEEVVVTTEKKGTKSSGMDHVVRYLKRPPWAATLPPPKLDLTNIEEVLFLSTRYLHSQTAMELPNIAIAPLHWQPLLESVRGARVVFLETGRKRIPARSGDVRRRPSEIEVLLALLKVRSKAARKYWERVRTRFVDSGPAVKPQARTKAQRTAVTLRQKGRAESRLRLKKEGLVGQARRAGIGRELAFRRPWTEDRKRAARERTRREPTITP